MILKGNLPRSGKRFAVPSIMQMELTECGAACLGMIFAYYKNWIPLETLRIECGVNQHGSNAAMLITVARKYGFIAKGVQCEFQGLKDLPFPMILFWNYSHFVVLEGIKGKNYYINDPASGPEIYTEKTFKKFSSNICLLIQPGPNFRSSNQLPPSEIKNLLFYLSQNKSDFIFICLITALLAIPGLCFPLLIKMFVDDILPLKQSGYSTTWFFWIVYLIFLCSLGLSWLQHIVIARFEMKIAINVSKKLFTHILSLPLKYFSQRYPGDISQRIYSVEILSALISGPVSNVIGISLMVIYGIAMVFYSPPMACVVFASSLILLIVFFKLFKKRANNAQKLQNEVGQSSGVAAADLEAVETIQANGNIRSFFERSNEWQTRITNSFQKEHIYNLITGILPLIGSTAISILVLGYGGWSYSQGVLSLGDLLAFQALALNFITPFSTFIALGGLLSTSKAHFNRINDVINYPQDKLCQVLEDTAKSDTEQEDAIKVKDRLTSRLPSKKLSGHIELRNITFGHDPNAIPLFENFSLSIKPQERIALLGRSGSGKSTLAELICGLQHPWSGQILFDGEELHNIPTEIVVQSISYVSQDIFLFDGTVRENLSLWDPLIPGEDMIAALKDAHIHDEIYARPGRLDSQIVCQGGNFSGGERQRLEIARALSNRPSILILDEATSALDPIVEAKIEDNLRQRGCTCIVIAHRLSTIRGANQLILLDRGKIVERGHHQELKEQGNLYQKLLSSGSQLT